ncbi:hypothetical protein I316_04364 [Kwoniella heveanensis BCC8398]|uniref:Nucleoporin Nup159/Nup146 N-terminal domain-containing protein n=1 Tax=Kwoniella heveanensis BCC8398 TaxID=1296120 RepID=A0A1B9GSS0_9TREE|nr:hypothetical protein I316_04364 [Kwoniella heveanensis BCC8398]
MFGNGGNSFGALAMQDDGPAAAGPSSQVVDGDEVDVDWVQLVKTNHDVNVRVSDAVDLEGLPSECNLMVVSNNWGLLIVGSNQDVRIHRLPEFHTTLEDAAKDASPVSTPIQIIPLSARPVWIRLAMNEERLVVATNNGSGIHLFHLKDIVAGNTDPYHSFTSDIPTHLLDVLPNPSPSTADQLSRYVTLLGSEGFVIADIEERRLLAPVTGPFTCGDWSAKGKQIVLGEPTGKLLQYTPEGVSKAEIPSPPDLDSFFPTFVQWLENDLFLVSYAQPDGQPDDPIETYIIHRTKSEITFTKFFDPLNTMGVSDRSGAYRHFAGLKSWGDRTKHLAFVVSGLASEIGILHGNAPEDKEPPKWEVLILEETERGILPAAKAGVRDDASVLALSLDLTSDKIIRQGIVGGIEQPDLPPLPRLLAYTQEGVVISFDVRYAEAGKYPGLVTPQDIIATASPSVAQPTAVPGRPQVPPIAATSAVDPASSLPAPTSKPTPSAFGASGGGAFGSSSFGSSAFGQTTPSKPTSTFGSSAFGQTSAPAFGSSSKPTAFGASAFGQSSTQTSSPAPAPNAPSAFGNTSKPSSFGGFGRQPSSSSAFGQSAFGQSSKPSAFGTTPTSTPSKPSAFGGSTTPSAFGTARSSDPSKPSAFGASVTPSAFGSSSTPTSNFGQSTFGQPSKPASTAPTAFGSSTTPSAFGSSSSTSSGSNLGFGGFGSGIKTASTSTPSAFGASAFGQPANKTTNGQTSSPAASPFGSGGSAFGSGSAFGGGGSAFGSTSAFGQKPAASPAAEQKQPAFGGFGQQKVDNPKPASPAPQVPSSDGKEEDFGLGGFASALDTSTQPSKVPGLADSPPASPVLGASKKQPGGLDDSPPTSPIDKPVTLKSTTAQPATSSSFIKPATAFGSGSSFGAFGSSSSAKSSTPAFGVGSIPSAFSASTSDSSKPSAFGPSSGFGKPSTIGAPGKPTFGGSAFGQSSLPADSAFGQSSMPNGNAFGKTSSPGSAKPFGNITGGFGAFGSKAESSDNKPTGFGGFASSGTSVFGSAADKEKKEERDINVFGAAAPQPAPSAFSFASKPASPPSISASPAVEKKVEAVPKLAEDAEEVKGFDVPDTTIKSEEKTTTPPATPSKGPQSAESTTSTQIPAKEEHPAESTAPDSKPVARETTTPDVTPVKGKSYAAAAAAEEPSSDTENKPTEVGAVEDHADPDESSVTGKGESDRDDHDATPEEEEDEDYHEEYDREDGEEDAERYEEEDDYEDEEEYEDEEDYEEEGNEEDYHPQSRRRSTSIPPDMSPIKEEASDDLASEEDGKADDEEEQEDEEGNEDTEDDQETVANKSLTKSPPAWFTKPLKTDGEEAGPTSPTAGSAGAPLFSRLSPAPTSAPVASPPATDESTEPALAPILAPTPTPAAPKLPPSFSFKHAARTSSPLAGPPANAESTTPESSPAKPAAASFSLFGNNTANTAGTPTPSSTSLFGVRPAETQPNDETKPAAATGAFPAFGAQSAPIDTTEEKKTSSPAPGEFGLFGPKPAQPPAKIGGFAGFGTPEPSKPIAPTEPFSGFGNKLNDMSLSAGPPPLFGAAKTVPPVPAEAPNKSAFGLGLGRPGSTGTTPPAFSTPSLSATPALPETKPSFSFLKVDAPASEHPTKPTGFGGFNVPSPAPMSTRPIAEPPKATEPKPTIPTKFSVPIREKTAAPATISSTGARSMAAVVEQIILTLQSDIQHLKSTLETNAQYHAAFSIAKFPHIDVSNIPSHDSIPFSSIPDLTAIVDALSEELAQLRSTDNESELKLAEVQSRMSKTDMKVSQAEKFLKARRDPTFARIMQVQELSPEQSASQNRLRKAVQITESRLEELESSINGLRRKAERHEQGRGDSQPPALERVQRSVRNIDAAIRDRQQTIDDLARRIGGMRLASPGRAGSSTLSRTQTTPRKSTLSSSASVQASISATTISLDPIKDVLKEVEDALNVDNDKILNRLANIRVARLTRPTQLKKGTKGPVMIDALPMPALLPPPTPAAVPRAKSTQPAVASPAVANATPLTPSFSTIGESAATPSPSPAPSFGGIKLSLDPGNISDLAASRSGNSLTRSGGASSGSSHRTHAPAAKFVPHSATTSSSSSDAPNGSPVPLGGSDLFAFKKKGNDGASKDQESEQKAGSSPAGFFRYVRSELTLI